MMVDGRLQLARIYHWEISIKCHQQQAQEFLIQVSNRQTIKCHQAFYLLRYVTTKVTKTFRNNSLLCTKKKHNFCFQPNCTSLRKVRCETKTLFVLLSILVMHVIFSKFFRLFLQKLVTISLITSCGNNVSSNSVVVPRLFYTTIIKIRKQVNSLSHNILFHDVSTA